MLLRVVAGILLPLLACAAETPRGEYTAAERRHWAFQARRDHAAPKTPGASNPIDAFVRAAVVKRGLTPAPPANRRTLIRRVTYDLTGLPPSPAEIAAFLKDTSPRAYEKLVDRLLASPRYGEKWGGHWLDVVRFAESDGFEYDTHRNDAWRYRDYVIRAFNDDKPYDQFVREQVAGDEISRIDEEKRIAAGFNRLGPLRKNAGNQEVASSRNEVLTEMTNIVGSALLGVTLGCARCHDHKFDPIRHTDYYQMQAFFASTHTEDVPLAAVEEQAAYKKQVDALDQEIKAVKKRMAGSGATSAEIAKAVSEIEDRKPAPLPSLFSVTVDPKQVTPIHVLARGEYQNRGARVHARTLGILLADPATDPELPPDTPAPRTRLASWIVSPENPLTARVIVNRIWAYHFGRGIVATPNDFGRMGGRPSHPELLDYLANRFIEGGWRMKPLHREILLSATYRQSYRRDPRSREKDPHNIYLSRFERRRLQAEEIRDSALAISGKLNLRTGGPGVITPADEELIQLLYKPSQWKVDPDPTEHDRGSIYLFAKRNLRLPLMEVFDAPDYQISCPKRESSTHAPQALELLNGHFTTRISRSLAERLRREAGADPGAQIELAYKLATGRPPSASERAIALEFLKSQPLEEFALATLNLNAFLYVE